MKSSVIEREKGKKRLDGTLTRVRGMLKILNIFYLYPIN